MSEKTASFELPVEELRWNCDPGSLEVESTSEAACLEEKVMAQERAVTALKFGMTMKGADYNIFVAGEPQTGLSYIARTFLGEKAEHEGTPGDWCYVYNFRSPDEPRAVSLPRGMAAELSKDMDELIDHAKMVIPETFEGEHYRQRRDEIHKKFSTDRNAILAELDKHVTESGFILKMSDSGMMIMPAKEGRPFTEEDLAELSEDQKDELKKKSEELQVEMNNSVQKIRKMEKKIKKRLEELDQRITLHDLGFLFEELQEKYSGQRAVLSYLLEVKNDIVRNLDDFKPKEQQPQMPFPVPREEADFTRYKVNVLVDNSEVKGAPIVYETNPTFSNLFGAMERKASFGALFTDFTMIRPGALHRANGGYLLIQARDILKWPLSWEMLNRALKNKEIYIEDQAEMMGVITAKGMKPAPIPLNVKVLLVGEAYIYNILLTHDDQFKKLFKVKAHLDDQILRGEAEVRNYIAFAARVVEEEKLRHVDKTGLSRLLEYGVELSGRKKKLTLKMALIRDMLREADYWAAEAGAELILREHVDQAIRQKKFRSSLFEDRMHEHIVDGYVNVDTTGTRVGQINGLSVFDLGDYSFGRPSRITASVSMGRQGVAAIDRESKLSGAIHTKGVLIMEGYLRGRYALDRPLSLSASLVFEQTYGMVDGDSASAAELFVLLSRLADVPLRQDLAVTGAISQLGEIQPIGGVNQKIEGFFEVCRTRGLTGTQGVIIPKANAADLMLKGQVIDAVREGKFKVFAVDHADQALELLTGLPAGDRDEEGVFPEGSFNRLVEDKIREMAEKAKKLMKDEDGPEKTGGEGPDSCDGCGGTC